MMKTIAGILVLGIAFAFVACTEQPPQSSVSAASDNTADHASAERAFSRLCAICHGKDGKMQYAGAKDLSQSTMSMDERVAIIKYGKGQMTPFGDRLSDDEIRALASYVETLRE